MAYIKIILFIIICLLHNLSLANECFKPVAMKLTNYNTALDVVASGDAFYVLDDNKVMYFDENKVWGNSIIRNSHTIQTTTIIKDETHFIVGSRAAVYTSDNLIEWLKDDVDISDSKGIERSIGTIAFLNGQYILLPHGYKNKHAKKMSGWGGKFHRKPYMQLPYDAESNKPLLFGSQLYNLEKTFSVPYSSDIMYQDGSYYLLSRRNGVYISQDLKTWSYLSGGSSEKGYNQAIASSGNTFVIVGDYGFLEVSHDKGKHWKQIDITQQNDVFKRPDLYDVLWDGKQFIAVGNCGAIAKSKDGDTWEFNTTGKPDFYTAIAYNGKQYMIVGIAPTISDNDSGKRVFLSDDAKQWKDLSSEYMDNM